MTTVSSKFDGQGQVFKAKLIGVENVPASRGDEMTQKALVTMKAAVLVAKEHKPKILLRIAHSGVQIIDASNEQVLHDHVVTRISYIARDATDNRAFGYIYTTPGDKFQFIGIKTEKAAEQVVSALSELFNELLELKRKAAATTAAADTVVASSAATAAVAPVTVLSAPPPATQSAGAVSTTAAIATSQLLRDGPPHSEAWGLTQGDTAPAVTLLPPAAPPGLVAAASQPGAPSSLLGLDLLHSANQNQAIQQVQLTGYGGAQLPVTTAQLVAGGMPPQPAGDGMPAQAVAGGAPAQPVAVGMPAQPMAGSMPAQPGMWPIAGPQSAPMIVPQHAAQWPAAAPLQQPPGAIGGITGAAYIQPFAPTPFLPLGVAQPGGSSGAFNQAWQQPGAWAATAEPFANDPFFSTPSSFSSTGAAAATGAFAPLQPQKAQALQAAPAAGGQQWQQLNGVLDALADIDPLGKPGQKPLRRDEFFSDIKSPPKKTLLEMAQQPTARPAPEAANNSSINARY